MVRLYCEHEDGSKMNAILDEAERAASRAFARGLTGSRFRALVHGPVLVRRAAARTRRLGQDRALALEADLRRARDVGLHDLFEELVVEDRRRRGRRSSRRGRARRSRADNSAETSWASTGPPTEKTTLPRPWTRRTSTRRLRRKSWMASMPEREAVVEREQAAALDEERLAVEVAAVRAAPGVVDEEGADARRPQDPLERGARGTPARGAKRILPLYQATQPLRTNTVAARRDLEPALGSDLEEGPRLGRSDGDRPAGGRAPPETRG